MTNRLKSDNQLHLQIADLLKDRQKQLKITLPVPQVRNKTGKIENIYFNDVSLDKDHPALMSLQVVGTFTPTHLIISREYLITHRTVFALDDPYLGSYDDFVTAAKTMLPYMDAVSIDYREGKFTVLSKLMVRYENPNRLVEDMNFILQHFWTGLFHLNRFMRSQKTDNKNSILEESRYRPFSVDFFHKRKYKVGSYGID